MPSITKVRQLRFTRSRPGWVLHVETDEGVLHAYEVPAQYARTLDTLKKTEAIADGLFPAHLTRPA